MIDTLPIVPNTNTIGEDLIRVSENQLNDQLTVGNTERIIEVRDQQLTQTNNNQNNILEQIKESIAPMYKALDDIRDRSVELLKVNEEIASSLAADQYEDDIDDELDRLRRPKFMFPMLPSRVKGYTEKAQPDLAKTITTSGNDLDPGLPTNTIPTGGSPSVSPVNQPVSNSLATEPFANKMVSSNTKTDSSPLATAVRQAAGVQPPSAQPTIDRSVANDLISQPSVSGPSNRPVSAGSKIDSSRLVAAVQQQQMKEELTTNFDRIVAPEIAASTIVGPTNNQVINSNTDNPTTVIGDRRTESTSANNVLSTTILGSDLVATPTLATQLFNKTIEAPPPATNSVSDLSRGSEWLATSIQPREMLGELSVASQLPNQTNDVLMGTTAGGRPGQDAMSTRSAESLVPVDYTDGATRARALLAESSPSVNQYIISAPTISAPTTNNSVVGSGGSGGRPNIMPPPISGSPFVGMPSSR